MDQVLKELFEDFDDIPFWMYLMMILAALSFFPLMAFFFIALDVIVGGLS